MTVQRTIVVPQIPPERISAVVERSAEADGSEAEQFFATLDHRFRHIRAFAPLMLATLRFGPPRATRTCWRR